MVLKLGSSLTSKGHLSEADQEWCVACKRSWLWFESAFTGLTKYLESLSVCELFRLVKLRQLAPVSFK